MKPDPGFCSHYFLRSSAVGKTQDPAQARVEDLGDQKTSNRPQNRIGSYSGPYIKVFAAPSCAHDTPLAGRFQWPDGQPNQKAAYMDRPPHFLQVTVLPTCHAEYLAGLVLMLSLSNSGQRFGQRSGRRSCHGHCSAASIAGRPEPERRAWKRCRDVAHDLQVLHSPSWGAHARVLFKEAQAAALEVKACVKVFQALRPCPASGADACNGESV